jgi:hypothetical protein
MRGIRLDQNMIFELGATSFDANDVETTTVQKTLDGSLAKLVLCGVWLPALAVLGCHALFGVWPDFVREFMSNKSYFALPEGKSFELFFLLFAVFALLLHYMSLRNSTLSVRLKSGVKVRSNPCTQFLAKAAASKLFYAKKQATIPDENDDFEPPISGAVRLRDILAFEAGANRVATIIAYVLGAFFLFGLFIGPPKFDFSHNGLEEVLALILLPVIFAWYFYIGGYWSSYIFVWEDGKILRKKEKTGNRVDVKRHHENLTKWYSDRIGLQD